MHVHTSTSFDSFSKIEDLVKFAKFKNINTFAITDHDELNLHLLNKFQEKDIHIIPGCEFTTDLGAHIIGIFISGTLPAESTINTIIQFIKKQNGLIVIPHPLKKGSGLLNVYGVNSVISRYVLENADFIELYNGGISIRESDILTIERVSQEYCLCKLSNSDSHKPWLIGNYYNEYSFVSNSDELEIELRKKTQPKLHYEYRKNVKSEIDKIFENKYLKYIIKTTLKKIPFKLKKIFKYLLYLSKLKRKYRELL